MAEEKVYRQEGFGLPRWSRPGRAQYRLRRLINQRLDHRNFSSFVNGYRLAEATAALADPAQADVPILTIALDAGFQSIGPFNRCPRAPGMTPTAYRKQADSRTQGPIQELASRVPKSARPDGHRRPPSAHRCVAEEIPVTLFTVFAWALPVLIVLATVEGLILTFAARRAYDWRSWAASATDALVREYRVSAFVAVSLAGPLIELAWRHRLTTSR